MAESSPTVESDSMAESGQAARAARTRRALLQAAGEILEKKGLDALTLRALGAAAGVSRSASYRHFESKEDLLAAVATQGMRTLRTAMTEASAPERAGTDPLARLEGMLIAYLDGALAAPAHYRLIFGSELVMPEHPELVAEGAATHDLLLRTVADGQATGALPAAAPSQNLAAMLWSTTHGLVDLIVSGHGRPEKGLGDPHALIRLLLTSVGGREPCSSAPELSACPGADWA